MKTYKYDSLDKLMRVEEIEQDKIIQYLSDNLKKVAEKLESFEYDRYVKPNNLKRSFNELRGQPFDPEKENICISCGKRYEYNSYYGRHLKQVCGLKCLYAFHISCSFSSRLLFKFDLFDKVNAHNTRYYVKKFNELIFNDLMFQKWIVHELKKWDKRDLARTYLENQIE